MCNSIVPTLHRKIYCHIFKILSVDMYFLSWFLLCIYEEFSQSILGMDYPPVIRKQWEVERPHWLYLWSRNTLSDADRRYRGHSFNSDQGKLIYVGLMRFLIFLKRFITIGVKLQSLTIMLLAMANKILWNKTNDIWKHDLGYFKATEDDDKSWPVHSQSIM